MMPAPCQAPAAVPRHAPIRIEIARSIPELEGCHRLRREVFVGEQHLFDRDDSDGHDAGAVHLAALCGDEVVGVVRCYCRHGGTWFGGRLAVAPAHRTGTLGARLVRRAVEEMEARAEVRRFYATVQAQNVRFFTRLGWLVRGRPFLLAGHEHSFMEYPLRGGRS